VILAGFAAFAIPFSFAAAALLAGRSDAAWIAHTRRFALVAWGLQSTGLVLGMWWAYHVLGWGGYWGWGPVENVALMPWLPPPPPICIRRRCRNVAAASEPGTSGSSSWLSCWSCSARSSCAAESFHRCTHS